MAASVNNIAATFAASRAFPPASSAAATASTNQSSSSSPLSTAAFSSVAPVRPISAAWNPHCSLGRSHRYSLLGLYGLPGPRPGGLPALLRPQSPRRSVAPASIAIGHRLSNTTLSYLDMNDAVRTISISELTGGRKAVIMAVPGAFAPPPRSRWCCGASGGVMAPEVLVRRAGEMREKGGGAAGVIVALLAANDVYVMRAWGEQLGAEESGVLMLSDPDAELAAALGLALDLRGGAEGFGVRSEGYCMVAVDGVVKALLLNNRHLGGDDSVCATTSARGFDDVLSVL